MGVVAVGCSLATLTCCDHPDAPSEFLARTAKTIDRVVRQPGHHRAGLREGNLDVSIRQLDPASLAEQAYA